MSLFRRRQSHAPVGNAETWLVVGLGNPGKEYARNRHNVGFMVADRWAERHGIECSRRRPWAIQGEGQAEIEGRRFRVVVAKPRTFMNLSGDAVIEITRRHQVAPQRVIVVYDDLDLPLGKLRLRERGSAGGHKGMGHIIQRLGTGDLLRIRVGIGRPQGERAGAADYVLGDFGRGERGAVEDAIVRACDALDTILAQGAQAAMTKFNA
jgi:PTH1 family peptidyl-tRNA hydrolase